MNMNRLTDVAEREVAIRKAVYARKVAEGRMRQDHADYQVKSMQEIAAVLHAISKKWATSEELLAQGLLL